MGLDKGLAVPVSSEGELSAKKHLEQLLREARQEFLRSGEPMLSWEGLEREIAGRRDGVIEEEGRLP
jgi:hypothetical protein